MADLSIDAIPNAMLALNALTADDLEPWTLEQLYQWADEELKRLAFQFGLNVARVASRTVQAQAVYDAPAGHIATIHVDVNGAILRPANVRELEALDSDWEDSRGTPTRFVMDFQGTDTVRLYRVPTATVPMYFVSMLEFPEVTPKQTVVSMSPLVADSIALRVVAEARRQEGDSQMPDAVAFAEQLSGLYDQIIDTYYGSK
jgi:hypothetical protein